eukprot:TRINITY_DN32571_c0_g1_i1.p1 TRINITY_DN32571_c0_g1~~TRINITY_DN32571_c0_g1_i1.p1  ORF type:complete len:1413 (-),score=393.21 TRINITY_DN32571_c0_g1_i1:294-4532(-)
MRRLFTVGADTHGKGHVIFAWQKQGNYMATAGHNRRVNIVDRQGTLYDQFSTEAHGAIIALDWDYTGEVLAVLQKDNTAVTLYTLATKTAQQLDSSMKDLSWLSWSQIGPQLAVGTGKGNLLLYNRKTLKKTSIVGKHTKKVMSGAWSITNRLALGGEDKRITISNAEGDILDPIQVKGDPGLITFSDAKGPGKRDDARDTTVTAVINAETLWLYKQNEPDNEENPVELKFQERYGKIVSYQWFGDGYLLIGFASGIVVVISTHQSEIGQEVSSAKFHTGKLADVTYCPVLMKGASIGDKCVKIFDMADRNRLSDQRAERFDLDEEDGMLDKLHWTSEGQILTVSSKRGNIYAFLTRIPVLHDTIGTRVLYLTSLRELCVKDVAMPEDEAVLAKIGIDIEPAFVAVGPTAVAVGMNTSVSYYQLQPETKNAKLLHTRTYPGTVDCVRLGRQHACVLIGGRVTVHLIEQSDEAFAEGAVRQHTTFPQKDATVGGVRKIAVTDKFLIYATDRGHIIYFSFDEWTTVNEYLFERPIKQFWPNPSGTRVVLVDESNQASVYNPVNDHAIPVNGFPAETEVVLWDSADLGLFVGADLSAFTTFVYSAVSRWGPVAEPVMIASDGKEHTVTTPRPFGFLPVLVASGVVVAQMPSGELVTLTLATHQHVVDGVVLTTDQLVLAFYNHLSLLHLDDAYRVAARLQLQEAWVALGDKALQVLDIDLALRVYRHLAQPTMVFALERVAAEAERSLLLAHAALLFKNFADAQTHFLHSSRPRLALEMRRDLRDFDAALKLAESLAPDEVPALALLQAQTLEGKGEVAQALDMYERAIVEVDEDAQARRDVNSIRQDEKAAHNLKCHAGIARCTLRLGQLRKGSQMALDTGDKALMLECANILLDIKQPVDAAGLFEAAEDFDAAAVTLVQAGKMGSQMQKLLKKCSTARPWLELAKAKEKEKLYREAEAAYEKAGDVFDVIRINADHLKDYAKAFRVVREHQHPEGAVLVAKHAQQLGDYAAAVEFLLIGKAFSEGYDVAALHDQMSIYTKFLGDSGGPEDFQNIGNYYESKGQWELAGDFFVKCAMYEQALTRYLQVGDDCVRKAIAVVGKARDGRLTKDLFEHLGRSSNQSACRYTFEAYIALGDVRKAAHFAVLLAKQEQQDYGNYRLAHTLLFDMFRDLQAAGYAVTHDLRRSLMLVHSYLLIKVLNKLEDKEGSARMLVRVSRNINQFARHQVQIMTSTVIECLRVGMKGSAYEFASILVRPEFRKLIPEKFKSKIEGMVRKKSKDPVVDPDEPSSACPFCHVSVPVSSLQCDACKSPLPFCIVTGLHMVLTDWTVCPSCRFPALYSRFTQLVEAQLPCPMCDQTVVAGAVKKIEKPDPSKAAFMESAESAPHVDDGLRGPAGASSEAAPAPGSQLPA